MPKEYSVSEEKKKDFASLYLLDKMISEERDIRVYLEKNDKFLDPIFSHLMLKEAVEIREKKGDQFYVPTLKGNEILERFKRRYYDYLRHYDIYCAVDLALGEFAFEDYFEWDHEDPDDEEDWLRYLNEERWTDLRVTIADFKKLDAVEIVFMNFLTEDRFGEDAEGWQFDLLLGSIWDEIIEICNTAISIDELAYNGEDSKYYFGENVIRDVITEGAKLNLELKKQEGELYGSFDDDEFAEEEEEPQGNGYEVYEYYLDPLYVSPFWTVPIFF